MSRIGRMQVMSDKRALELIKGKPCRLCGQPATCAIREWGVAPICYEHALRAKTIGYIVTFPEPQTEGEG